MIVSIYIESHEYLTKEPQTINFGGKYLYSFKKEGPQLNVSRKSNAKYMPGFFNIVQSKCEIELLSAIVGGNGAGKSSILDSLRSVFSENPHAMPHKEITILVEKGDETRFVFSDHEKIMLEGEMLKRAEINEYQTIYYSPHFDLKYNLNFDNPDSYDISLDIYVKKDLMETKGRGINDHGVKYDLHEELVYKNALRQIDFLNSSLFENANFRGIFDIPEYKTGILYIRDLEIPKFHNTPLTFIPILEKILQKIDSEEYVFQKNYQNNFTKSDNEKQLEFYRFRIECSFLKAIVSVIINQMEKANDWLNEGYFDKNISKEKIDKFAAKELFFYFIENSFIQKGTTYKKKVFKEEEIKQLYKKIIAIIANETQEYNLSQSSFRIGLTDLKEILVLHRKINTNLIHYYLPLGDIYRKGSFTSGFLDFRPTDRSLSSGETALLNFFSKLYDFVQNNLVEERKILNNIPHCILLLDEADLGFHPIWKRKYVTAILKTIPYFFDSLKLLPKLQIIITTHDPLTLSDLPADNVVFLSKTKDGKCIVENDDKDKIKKTFGANITDLLADSFFIGDGLIGDFARLKIEEVITWIRDEQNEKDTQKLNYHPNDIELQKMKDIINLIDEKVIKIKLAEMITELHPDDNSYYNGVIDSEIKYLERRRR